MKRAFIVDDEVHCIRIISSLIEKHQIPMEICGSSVSGETALLLIPKLKPDIVFMDIEMPGLNGLEVIGRLRRDADFTGHMVVISAYDSFKYAQEAMRLGVTDFLLKPIDGGEFLDMVQRVFGLRFTSNQAFNEILLHVNDHFGGELELNACAERFHMSANHISRLFLKYTGVTFTQYKNRLRIQQACRLLKESDLSIAEIGDRAGFTNLTYFYRQFRSIAGMTPKDYRGFEERGR